MSSVQTHMANKWWVRYVSPRSVRTELALRATTSLSPPWRSLVNLRVSWSLLLLWFHLGFGMHPETWPWMETGNGRGHAFQASFKFYSYCEESCIPTENMSGWKKIMTKGLQKDPLKPRSYLTPQAESQCPKSKSKTKYNFIKYCFDITPLSMSGQALLLSL